MFKFGVKDEKKPLVPNDENEDQGSARCDQEGQTQELRSQQGEARYGTINIHPAGTVLLETRMRYGEISYRVRDVVKRMDEWQLPDEDKAHLKEKHGLTPKAKIKFVSEGNGKFKCIVAEEKPCWCKCVICIVACAAVCYRCLTTCWAGLTRCMRATWARICGFVRRRCGCGC